MWPGWESPWPRSPMNSSGTSGVTDPEPVALLGAVEQRVKSVTKHVCLVEIEEATAPFFAHSDVEANTDQGAGWQVRLPQERPDLNRAIA